ncbi:hypothetical protein RHMOL_Rhmol10G0188400 [Rhododendron molle]|uniref:Uncharacterized protein n=1 Tax=Rhododendron molle TaxID=49168 RepID=A0ACC0M4B8_RHOML|nr:hypothetical protein RHMOL_Rhmol10G0188400 [Rhododendron molle]
MMRAWTRRVLRIDFERRHVSSSFEKGDELRKERLREMDDGLKGKNVVIDISDNASDDDGHNDDDGYGDDDGHNDDGGYGVDDGLDDYRLDELTEEDVYE